MAVGEYGLLNEAFSAYLQVGPSEKPDQALNIAYAAGRQAANFGYPLGFNPYNLVQQRPHYDIWIAGFGSARRAP
jgi:hypothetical protein